jgi:hypothetical protein
MKGHQVGLGQKGYRPAVDTLIITSLGLKNWYNKSFLMYGYRGRCAQEGSAT